MTNSLIKVFTGLLLMLELLSFKAYSQRHFEDLGRGLVAVQTSGGVFLSWRLLGTEWENTTYNVYRDGAKLNASPLEVSNYTDQSGSAASSYTITAINSGEESQPSEAVTPASKQYHEITLKQRDTQKYEINDGTAADLDGDGEYEIIIKRMIGDWSVEATEFTYFEAYKLDGTLMWEINVGPNIMSSSGVEINIAAFDLDEDGKAEVFMRTSEGTIFGDGTQIGDTDGDGRTNYRYSVVQSPNMQYMNAGPEFLSLIDGETGAEIDRVDFIPRGNSSDWGDSYGHRANKFFFGAPYLDGIKPSLFIGRGIYTRTVMRTYDVVNKQLVLRWQFDSNSNPGYAYQGNHNYTVADVDGDGRDEIVWGSMTVDDNGKGLYSTELGHGDALHVGDLDPFRKGTEIWKCLENSPVWGTVFYDGATGEVLIHDILGRDCGRCVAANISDNVKGAALWGSTTVFSAATKTPVTVGTKSYNFRIYWDGDLLEEMLDHNYVYGGEGIIQKESGTIFTATGTLSCNYTKGTPTLQADLYGDWREEAIWRTADNTKIRIYTTTDPTPHRVYTLMHDHQYRQAICWQMCGYNQPPHVSFFLGEAEGKTVPPPPAISNDKLIYNGSGNWSANAAIWNKNGTSASNTDGEKILFDVSAGDNISLSLTENVTPASVTVNSPGNCTLDASEGKLGGTMSLVKQGKGEFTLSGIHDYQGETEVWQGKLSFDGELTNSHVLLEFFSEMDATGSLKKGVTQRYGSVLSIASEGQADKLTIAGDLKLEDGATLNMDISSAADQGSDTLTVDGDVELAGSALIHINWNPADPATEVDSGKYTLLTFTGNMTGDLSMVKVGGLPGRLYELTLVDKSIVLEIKAMRQAATVIWNGDEQSNVWDLAKTDNFTIGADKDVFVTGDNVVFNDDAGTKSVNIVEDIAPASVWVNSEADYSFSGTGKITGEALLKKSGTGTLSITNTNDFSGQVIITEGVLEATTLPNEQNAGSIGVYSSDPSKLQIDGGELKYNGEAHVNRAISAGANAATLNIGKKTHWHEKISGETLIKKGSGELILGGVNTHKKTVLQQGQLSLYNEETNAGKTVELEGGTLQFYDNSGTYSTISTNLVCEEGKRANLNMDSRAYYTGSLTGAGTLLINIPFVRTEFKGNWSNFEGTLKFASTNGSGIADVRLNNSFGWGKAAVYLGTNTIVYNLANTAFAFGELTGVGSLTGNNGWIVGGKNTDARFDGNIDAGSLTKTGSGKFTLPKANSYTGGTSVEKGTLILANTSGSATGSGTVVVKSGGNLAGQGSMQGSLSVQTGGAVSPGVVGTGTLTVNGSVAFADNAYYSADVDPATNKSDQLKVGGSVKLNGILYLAKTGTTDYQDGNTFKLFDASTINESFDLIIPSTPGDGLKWDLSEMNSAGTLKVALATGIEELSENNFKFYPNPVRDQLTIEISGVADEFRFEIDDITGRKHLETEQAVSGKTTLDLSGLKSGIYLLKVIGEDGILVRTIVKK